MRTERPRLFLAVLVALPTLLVLGAGAFSLVVDPFGVYRVWPARDGFNANKPRQKGHEKIVRAADLARLHPDALILGTSRAQIGLDPESPAWAGVAARPANSAFSDGSTWEALRYLQHAHALSPVKTVVFGADFLSFVGEGKHTPDFTETRLSVSAKGQPHRFWAFDDVPSALLSFDAVRISRSTVLEQSAPSYFFDTGRRRPDTMAARIEEQGGARGAFVWSERDYADSYACVNPQRLDAHLADFDALVSWCHEHQVRLIVFCSPSHARSLALLDAAGLWPELERYKRALAQREGPFELWDFSGADPRTTGEEVPAAGDTTSRTQWYWESSHYRKELGDLALARMLGSPVDARFEGWGERVTRDSAPAWLTRIATELAAWKSAHAPDVAELQRSVVDARAARHCEGSP
jgi:hypothetical protein